MKDKHIKKLIERNKLGLMRGKKNPAYKDGYFSKKRYCKVCNKELTMTGRRKWYYCNKHKFTERKIWNKGKKIGNLYNTHHKDANESNNRKSNKMIMKAKIHMKLHRLAYLYLVKIGKIDSYLKWFKGKGRYVKSYRN
jgi:hypothetical protein